MRLIEGYGSMALLTINDREYIVEAGTLLSDAIGLHHTLELPCGGKEGAANAG